MNAEDIQRTAADWLAKRLSDQWTVQDEAEFDLWIDADIAHRVQYIRIEAAWHHTARLKALGAGITTGVIPPRDAWGDARYYRGNIDLENAPAERGPERAPAQRTALTDGPTLSGRQPTIRAPQRLRYAALAATVLLGVLGSGYVAFQFFVANRFSTAIGAIDTVPLQDGSHITLNTDTSIHVDLGGAQRLIELEKGEAYFEVAKDPQRPFIVHAGPKRIIAVGTKFSVRRDGDDVQVAVTEGAVRLEEVSESGETSAPKGRERPTAHDRSDGGPVVLAAGAVARMADARIIIDQDAIADADRLLAWRRGYVIFDNTPLREAVAELNRYNVRKITIEDPALAEILIGGTFRAANTAAFLELLRSGHAVLVDDQPEQVILKAR
jgi:transmembrane sensor